MLKFTDQLILVQPASGGTLSQLNYKLNSVFQVNATSASGTPQGVAELSAKFKRYRVESSRISWRIRLLRLGENFGSLGVLGAVPTHSCLFNSTLYPLPSNGVAPTSLTAAAVQKYASPRYDWPLQILAPGAAEPEPTGINPGMVWRGMSVMTPAKLDADPDPKQASYVANFGADPTAILYWVFAFQDVLTDATAKGVFLVEVDIHQTVYAFDRVVVGDALMVPRPLRVVEASLAREQDEKKQLHLEPVVLQRTDERLSLDADSYMLVPRARTIPGRSASVKGAGA